MPITGRDENLPAWFLGLGAERSAAVGRVGIRRDGRLVGFGTGFLIARGLLMTCHHVIPDKVTAASAVVDFDYVDEPDGVFAHPTKCELAPEQAFVTDRRLDFTIVAVAGPTSGSRPGERPCIALTARSDPIRVGAQLNVVHHRQGEPLKVVVRGSQVLRVLEDFIHYSSSTLPGSGGAPVMDDDWRLVGLHHARTPDGLSEATQASAIARYMSASASRAELADRMALANRYAPDEPDVAPVSVGQPSPADAVPDLMTKDDGIPGTSVFLCYARDDQSHNDWKDRLEKQLAGVARFSDFSVWSDGRIAVGDDWRAEIDLALQRCRAAVLLIGPSFLTSEFIQTKELPALLRAHADRGVRVLPLITDYCGYKLSPLARFQSVNEPDSPLESLERPEQNRILLAVAERVAVLLARDS